jgi:hypothetical protein
VSQDGGCDGLASDSVPPNIDLLVYVAGVLENDSLADVSTATCMHQFNVNALGLLRTVTAVRPRLREGSRVLVLGSLLGSIEKSVHAAKPGRVRRTVSGLGMVENNNNPEQFDRVEGRRYRILSCGECIGWKRRSGCMYPTIVQYLHAISGGVRKCLVPCLL